MTKRVVARRVALGLLGVLVVALVVGTVFGMALVRRPFPSHAGEVTLEGLDGPVTVVRDARGIPHVTADTPRDLFRAQGYVTASDRFFQMDLRRHVGSGRLAELVGDAGLPSDRVVRTLGWRRVAEESLPKLAPTTRQYLGAYAEGVNDYLARAGEPSDLGLEYAVLGARLPSYRVERWSELDSLVWLEAMAWELKGNDVGELARARLAAVLEPTMVSVLFPPYPGAQHAPILAPTDWAPPQGSAIRSLATDGGAAVAVGDLYGRTAAALAAAGTAGGPGGTAGRGAIMNAGATMDLGATIGLDATMGAGEGIGSNGWVVGPAKSATGKPILAGDPHLAVGIPGVWYQTSLRCRTVSSACPFDVTGFALAGVPGIVIGHNAQIAWTLTNLPADVTDFYLEKITDTTYLKDGKQQPLAVSTELIKVRGGEDVTITVRRTGHGPVISDVVGAAAEVGRRPVVGGVLQQQSYAVSIAWAGLVPSATADAIFALDLASDFTAFRAGAKSFAVPAQNLLYADVSGNIGYQAPGLIPVRRASTPGAPPGYLPSPGWDSQWDWQGWVAFEDLPWTLNPPDGVIVAANQQVTASATPFLTSEWDYGWRSQRIRELLADTPRLTVADMARIQGDTRNQFAPTLVAALLSIDLSGDPFTREAQDLLRTWDFTQPADTQPASAAAAYYNAVWSRLLQATFDDQLPPDLRADGGGRWWMAVSALLVNSANPWWDDKRTPSIVENRDEILTRALVQARLDLTRSLGSNIAKWSWGRLHSLTLVHPVLGSDGIPGIIQSLADRGPVGVSGGSSIVAATAWDATKGYAVRSGPTMRMVVDLADLDASTWVTLTGASGHPGHPNYADQVGAWADGTTYAWPFTDPSVTAAKVEELRLVPKP